MQFPHQGQGGGLISKGGARLENAQSRSAKSEDVQSENARQKGANPEGAKPESAKTREGESGDEGVESSGEKIKKGVCNAACAGGVCERSGYHGVRDPRRSFGCDSHRGHNAFSPEDSGAMERDSRRHKRSVTQKRALASWVYFGRPVRIGQGSVEYALVTAAVLAALAACGLIVRAVGDGGIVQGVLNALTHRLPEGVLDIALF